MTRDEVLELRKTAQFLIWQEPCFYWYCTRQRQENGEYYFIDVVYNQVICSESTLFSYPQECHLFINDGTFSTELNRNYQPIKKRAKKRQ